METSKEASKLEVPKPSTLDPKLLSLLDPRPQRIDRLTRRYYTSLAQMQMHAPRKTQSERDKEELAQIRRKKAAATLLSPVLSD
eukprot:2158990-Rhodomonas_salina.1